MDEESDWRQEVDEATVKLLMLQHEGHGYLITVAEGLKVSKQMVLLPPQLWPCLFLLPLSQH